MKRGLMCLVLCMSAVALVLNCAAERAAGQGAAIAKSKGWQMDGKLNPASLKAAGNKPVMLVFR